MEMENKLVLSLVCLEQERTIRNSNDNMHTSTGDFEKKTPSIYLNLFILMSANYDAGNYLEALKMLSSSIEILHESSSFDRSNHPGMAGSLNRIFLEVYNMHVKDYSKMWNGIGAKSVPSILYKVRLL
jgi:hypothetical protein